MESRGAGRSGVLPGVDTKAIEGTDGGEENSVREQRKAKLRMTGDGRDEDGGGEEDADGKLFGKAVRGRGAGVDEQKPAGEERGKDGVEAEGLGMEAGKE
jgi:hypothetical protein